jgi:signal transduction histidine kinase
MMATTDRTWERRLETILIVLLWVSFALGFLLSTIRSGATPAVTISAFLAGAYTVVMQLLPRRWRVDENIGELIAVSGVVVGLIAVSLTGGIDSPYLLFLSAPSFYAGAFLGLRVGLETAALTTMGLVFVVATLQQEVIQGQVLQVSLLYTLMAVAFAQSRRILIEEQARGDALAEASAATSVRLERLEAAHSALTSLSDLATTAELNPVSVGQAALRDLALTIAYRAGQVIINDEEGPVVVARRGEPGPSEERAVFPMQLADRRIGHLALWPEPGASLEPRRGTIEAALRPVTLAYDNILLLRSIAHRAVQEERVRLARELHDEIGPSLASLGLGIDIAIQQQSPDPELARQLETLRRSVTSLVERVRDIVSDLRHDAVGSLVEKALTLASEVGVNGPAVVIEIDERRPPRASIAPDLNAILTEAVRNALEHADARAIRISGYVDRDRGTLIINDDGRGFDSAHEPRGHFGVIGMRERAAAINASVVVDSSATKGTTVTVEWGDRETRRD